jgi:AAA+ ATPase superfamily predicted ATPase
VKGKSCIFYTAIEDSVQRNLQLFSRRITECITPAYGAFSANSFEDAFAAISFASEQERVIVVIDEFPYLCEQDWSILSILQKVIDTDWKNRNIFLILSGSSVSFMEGQVLSEKSPLFGRRTAELRLEPFSYEDAAQFVPGFSPEDKAVTYAVTGGVALYLSLFDAADSLDENIIRLFFSKSGYLYEEPRNLLQQEFRNVSAYSAVISAVASGKTRITDISDAVHMSGPSVVNLVQNLTDVGLLRKRTAITEETNKRKILYVLNDGMFRFWYLFIPDAVDFIELEEGEQYYMRFVKPRLDAYMGSQFEDMCRLYTMKLAIRGELRASVLRVGTWWGTNPKKREQTDIDIGNGANMAPDDGGLWPARSVRGRNQVNIDVVGIDPVKLEAVLGECKYKNEVLDKSVYEALLERNGLIDRRYRTAEYLFFSKAGFSDWMMAKAKEDAAVRLISLEEMYRK